VFKKICSQAFRIISIILTFYKVL